MTPLAWAANKGGFDSAKALLQHGADVNAANCDGWTPLHWAAHSGHPNIVQLLLSHGANDSVRNKARAPSRTRIAARHVSASLAPRSVASPMVRAWRILLNDECSCAQLPLCAHQLLRKVG